jgi:hypothetical protein
MAPDKRHSLLAVKKERPRNLPRCGGQLRSEGEQLTIDFAPARKIAASRRHRAQDLSRCLEKDMSTRPRLVLLA